MTTKTRYLTVSEVAELWHLKDQAVRNLIDSKALTAFKIGSRWLIRPEDVEAYEATRRNVKSIKKRTSLPRRRTA